MALPKKKKKILTNKKKKNYFYFAKFCEFSQSFAKWTFTLFAKFRKVDFYFAMFCEFSRSFAVILVFRSSEGSAYGAINGKFQILELWTKQENQNSLHFLHS